jgi:hypothetical protein
MSDTTHTLRDDIAFVRALAEEGRQTPFRGEISLAAGVIWGSASLYSWSVASQVWHPPGGMSSVGWSWAVAAVAFILVGIPLHLYKVQPDTNRVAAAAWSGVGLACWTISLGAGIAMWRTHQYAMGAMVPPMIMALYGAAWLVCAVAFRAPWQRWVGVLSLLSSLALAFTAARVEEYLVFALSLYLLAGLPGLFAVLRDRAKA